MIIKDILDAKGRAVMTIGAAATVCDAVASLAQHRIGALVVTDDLAHVIGILSERDIVARMAQDGGDVLARPISELMTQDVVTALPDDPVEDVLALMTRRRIRHLPVLEDGKLSGIISIGDAVKERLTDLEFEAESLRSYIAGH